MALSILPYPGIMMPPLQNFSVLFAIVHKTLDGAGEKFAWVLRVGKAGDIRTIHFHIQNFSVEGDLDIRLESVSGGVPTGNLLATNTNKKITISSSGVKSATLTADATVAVDALIAIVFEADSSSVPTLSIRTNNIASNNPTGHYDSGGGYGIVNTSPSAFIEYSDGTYGVHNGCFPTSEGRVQRNASGTFDINDDPDEIGILFQFPFAFRVQGFAGLIEPDASFDMKLYDNDGSLLESRSYTSPGGTNTAAYYDNFASSYSLLADTTYRLSMVPTTTTTIFYIYNTMTTAAQMDSWWGGQNIIWTQRKDAGDWSEIATQRPMIAVLVDAVGTAGGDITAFVRSANSNLRR